MRDPRFVGEHRGGPLHTEQHRQLILWACQSVEHVLPLLKKAADPRVLNALRIGFLWAKGEATVGDARNAAFAAHAAAREETDPVAKAIARAAGHAVATAHMADHALGVFYCLIASKLSGKSVDKERNWQNEHLPPAIRELILSARKEKESHVDELKQ